MNSEVVPGDQPKRSNYREYLAREDINLADHAHFKHANKLAAYVEWLKHPEDHNGPRTILPPSGENYEYFENVHNPAEPRASARPVEPVEAYPQTLPGRDGIPPIHPGKQYYMAYESTIEKWRFSQFFAVQAATATQHIRPEPWGDMLDALTEVYWRIDLHYEPLFGALGMKEEAWKGEAGKKYWASVEHMCQAMRLVRDRLIDRLIPVIGGYCNLILRTREQLDDSARQAIDAFKANDLRNDDQLKEALIFILEIVLNIALGSARTLTAGTKDPISKILAGEAKGQTFDAVKNGIAEKITETKGSQPLAPTWAQISESYLHVQDEIIDGATSKLRQLTNELQHIIDVWNEADVDTIPK
nr:hypothetical protein [Kibdelosporangium sp. MJ126-NF4]CEL13821.1 hypothetical protein [Kibdelosporangium sp. MJ126-NF4]CTQ88189.1 hypothetical protein [Kibdelosporangium sp. MJ126-NF4]